MSNKSYHFKLGTFDCIVVSDGTFTYHNPAQMFFANAPKERLDQVLRKHNLDAERWEQYVSPYSSLVINTSQHMVLVDTGAGDMAPTTGQLIPNLQAEGIAPENIDTVILTHGHPDHIGGNIDIEGKPAFPNARYVMWEDEWKFWTSEPDLAQLKVDENIKQLILMGVRKYLPPIQGQLDLVDHEMEIVPGIHAVAAHGHTPGQMAVAIFSSGEQLLCISDTAIHPIHLEQPDWYAAVEPAPEQVVASRRQLLDRAATEKALVHAFHFSPFPSLGYVVMKGERWQWSPI
jgi:glyoxylase-like metal-dependent hydrolase (beta-lactamase superfamily II)